VSSFKLHLPKRKMRQNKFLYILKLCYYYTFVCIRTFLLLWINFGIFSIHSHKISISIVCIFTIFIKIKRSLVIRSHPLYEYLYQIPYNYYRPYGVRCRVDRIESFRIFFGDTKSSKVPCESAKRTRLHRLYHNLILGNLCRHTIHNTKYEER
jgi:hypothetical protein